jgi:hypothetical protein
VASSSEEEDDVGEDDDIAAVAARAKAAGEVTEVGRLAKRLLALENEIDYEHITEVPSP